MRGDPSERGDTIPQRARGGVPHGVGVREAAWPHVAEVLGMTEL